MAEKHPEASRAIAAELFWCDQLRQCDPSDPAYPVLKRLAESAGEQARAQTRI